MCVWRVCVCCAYGVCIRFDVWWIVLSVDILMNTVWFCTQTAFQPRTPNNECSFSDKGFPSAAAVADVSSIYLFTESSGDWCIPFSWQIIFQFLFSNSIRTQSSFFFFFLVCDDSIPADWVRTEFEAIENWKLFESNWNRCRCESFFLWKNFIPQSIQFAIGGKSQSFCVRYVTNVNPFFLSTKLQSPIMIKPQWTMASSPFCLSNESRKKNVYLRKEYNKKK